MTAPVPMTVGGQRVLAHPVVVVAHCPPCGARARLAADAMPVWARAHLAPHVCSVPVAVQCPGPGCTYC